MDAEEFLKHSTVRLGKNTQAIRFWSELFLTLFARPQLLIRLC